MPNWSKSNKKNRKKLKMYRVCKKNRGERPSLNGQFVSYTHYGKFPDEEGFIPHPQRLRSLPYKGQTFLRGGNPTLHSQRRTIRD